MNIVSKILIHIMDEKENSDNNESIKEKHKHYKHQQLGWSCYPRVILIISIFTAVIIQLPVESHFEIVSLLLPSVTILVSITSISFQFTSSVSTSEEKKHNEKSVIDKTNDAVSSILYSGYKWGFYFVAVILSYILSFADWIVVRSLSNLIDIPNDTLSIFVDSELYFLTVDEILLILFNMVAWWAIITALYATIVAIMAFGDTLGDQMGWLAK